MPATPRGLGAAALMAMLLVSFVAAVSLPGPTQAKKVTPAVCNWYGTAPACDGECPAGWTEKRRSQRGDGEKCLSGSKVLCCDFQEYCVPDKPAAGWDPNARKVEDQVQVTLTLCQVCTNWGDDCKGGNRFQTICTSYRWETCGTKTKPLPDEPSDVKRDCPPGYRVLAEPNKYGAYCEQIPVDTCPSGLTGPNCDQVIVK
jgi:hypothetical protein